MDFTIYVIEVDQSWVVFLARYVRFWQARFLWDNL